MSSIELINLSTDCLTKPPAESFSSVLRNAIPLPIGKLRRFRADNRQPALRLASVQLLKPATPRRVDHRRLNRSSNTFTLRGGVSLATPVRFKDVGVTVNGVFAMTVNVTGIVIGLLLAPADVIVVLPL